ncbi:MAG: NFACT RNA binding domain-containing protein [Myxococcota bacterium]
MEAPEPDLGRVQRVDGPEAHLVALSTYRRVGEDALKEVLLFDARSGIRRLAERPKGADADGFVRRLRKLLVGARVHAERGSEGRAQRLRLVGRGLDAVLVAEGGVPVLRDRASGKPLAGRRRLGTRVPEDLGWEGFAPPTEAAAPIGAPRDDARAELQRALRRARKRLARKGQAIARDAARADAAPALRHEAELITAHLSAYAPGSDTLAVVDWATDPPETRELHIDAALGARGAAETLFKRARRFERGAVVARERAAEVARELDALDDVLVTLEDPRSDVDAARRSAHAAGWIRAHVGEGARRRAPERKPYRSFRARDGGIVLVGRSAADNDTLTLRVARPHDLWLHARSVRGAHVVVPLTKREACPAQRLIDAATLAAHFSEAVGETLVEVQHTARRHVHKRRGSSPGAVHVSREKVLVLRYEAELARELIERELRE